MENPKITIVLSILMEPEAFNMKQFIKMIVLAPIRRSPRNMILYKFGQWKMKVNVVTDDDFLLFQHKVIGRDF